MILNFVLLFLALGYWGAPFFLWAVSILGLETWLGAGEGLWVATIAVSILIMVHPLRRTLISKSVLILFKKLKLVPSISETEREAIEAGNTWVEKEFFIGNPNIRHLMAQPLPLLTDEEQAFLDNEVEALCGMVDDWGIWKERDIPKDVWRFIRDHKFLGMVIGKEYGGLGFSPYAHSEVIKKIASRSFVTAIYVMVPNSLGPAELIHRYGTDEQKRNYLPKLANGTDIPCFGLTEVSAGSDAGNIQATGVVFKKDNELFVRLNWDKRYTSLAKISTLIGLAFRLKDPEHLLGDKEDIGVTCALVPTQAKGVTVTHRHDPLGVPFYNCPMQGKDVIIPVSSLVGGAEYAGKGWRMLMECLAAGRGISFPAQMSGSSQVLLRTVMLYSKVREQFHVPIGQFEGIQKMLADMAAFTYLIESLRTYTLSALQQGSKPAIIASISKYYSTEYSRILINHGMDVLGGAGISMGPKNRIAPYYIAAPIGITVEGANVLTRSLMIFGQGAFRAHPYAFPMIDAIAKDDVVQFDRNFFRFISHGIQNFFRSLLLSLTRGHISYPFSFKGKRSHYRRIEWASAKFAFLTDLAMGSLGGSLKFREALGGRFADILSNLYMSTAILRKFHADGERDEDWVIANHALHHLFHQTEIAFQGIYGNFPGVVGFFLKVPLFFSRLNPISGPVSDRSGHEILKVMNGKDSPLFRMTEGIYQSRDPEDHLIQLEAAAKQYDLVQPILRRAKKHKQPLSKEEEFLVEAWRKMQLHVVQVDEFTDEQYHRTDKESEAELTQSIGYPFRKPKESVRGALTRSLR